MILVFDIHSILKDKFNLYLLLALVLLGAYAFLSESAAPGVDSTTSNLTMHFFYSPTCSHCAAQEPFNDQLVLDYPGLKIIRHDVNTPEESRLLLMMAQNFSIGPESLGTPTTFVGNSIFVGFENSTAQRIRETVADCIDGNCSGSTTHSTSKSELTRNIDLPVFGKVDLSSLSLPLLAAVLGLIDGFNPCAMWVLVYLIGLVMNLRDKARLWLIVGTFLLASGVLYFLLMTAWLNAFLFLGYIRPVTIIVGLVAIGGGIVSAKEFLETKGAMVCEVTSSDDKKKITSRMRELVSAPLSLAVLAGIITLAFTVNSIEFVCSAAIPAVFTQVLALSNISSLEYYGYILLYDFFFMLDDLIIFGSAIFIYGQVGEKYAKYCKILGGAILLVLGIILLFAPEMLR